MKKFSRRIAVIASMVTLVIILAPSTALAQEPMEPSSDVEMALAQKPIELPPDAEMKMTAPPEAKSMLSLESLFGAEPNLKRAEGALSADTLSADLVSMDRVTYRAYKWQRGTTVFIPVATVASLCGDGDGCSLRMGMYNWDNTGRVASRESLFYYNNAKRVWRAERSDLAGKDHDGVIQHVMTAWACYFTDGIYLNWREQGDPNAGFGLLSWNQYTADCWLTIID